ncbi:hypothetical protein LCGC14_2195450 [marine sediment metagenome]|uniref:Uncharacterized protein n=1 Tax=marine sediment metagenome TaxID=412755 RepID=A0A0F9GE33_9ZZZZ
MKVDKYKARVEFYSEDDDHCAVYYDNRGEPYSQGITIELSTFDDTRAYVYLEKREALRLAKLITELYG